MTWVSGHQWIWTDRRWGQGYYRPVLTERPLEREVPVLEVLARAVADRSPMVRRVAGAGLIQRLEAAGSHAWGFAETLAADPSSAIAEWGRFAVARLEGTA